MAVHAKDINPLIKGFKASLKLRSEIFEYMEKNFTQLYYEWTCGKYWIIKGANAKLNKTC